MKKQFDLSNEIEFFKFCCSEEKNENKTNPNSNEKVKIKTNNIKKILFRVVLLLKRKILKEKYFMK